MRITLSWLKQFLDTNADIEQIIEALICIGLEVEHVINNAETHGQFIIAEIQQAEKHPSADNLKKCKVFDGQNVLDIICGATNARTGIRVVLAPIGAKIPQSGIIIKETTIRGEKSQGMLCSAVELAIGNDAAGIIELGNDAIPGNKYIDYAELNDPVIELSITPNRGDCLSIYGIARDLAAFGIGILKDNIPLEIKPAFQSPIKVNIKDKEICFRYAGRYIKNVQNKQSPKWLSNLLLQVGMKPISALVDITNYINLTFGRPLHAFDADSIKGEVTVRFAEETDSILLLSGEYKQLGPNVALISDQKGPIAIAGIMGGLDSACTFDTKNVFIEAANFIPHAIIKSGRFLKIDSESRYRFERGIDQEFIRKGLDLATQLIMEICGGEASEVEDTITEKFEPVIIDFNYYMLTSKLGKFIEHTKFENIVSRLGFDILQHSPERYQLKVPSWRNDISIPEDVVEEVARINGYDKIGITPLPGMEMLSRDVASSEYKLQQKVRTILASRGLNEVLTWSFVDEKIANHFDPNDKLIKIKNPISNDLGIMRKTIISNLAKIVKYNEQHSIYDLSLFEIGPVFYGLEPENQIYQAAIIRSGMVDRNHYLGQRNYSWEDVKHDIFAVLGYFKIDENVRLDLEVPKWYHPSKSGRIMLGKNVIGYFGEINPSISKLFDIKQPLFIAEINYQNIPVTKSKQGYKGPVAYSQYQPAERKLSFLVPADYFSGELIAVAKSVDKKLIQEVKIFDYVTNLSKIEEGYRVVGLSIVLQSDSGTLTTDMIDDIIGRVKTKVEAGGAKFRYA